MCVHQSSVADVAMGFCIGDATCEGSILFSDKAFSASITFKHGKALNFGSLDYVNDHLGEIHLCSGAKPEGIMPQTSIPLGGVL